MKRLIIGCGYVGFPTAMAWRKEGDSVYTLTRSPDRAAVLRQYGLQPLVGDITRPATLDTFPECDTILFAVGFDRSAGNSIEEVYVEGLRSVIDRISHPLRRFIYISSTGVYGQSGGEWVDEQSECAPTRAGGKACLAAESLLAASRFAEQRVVLRLAGIYGPGRVPRKKDLISGDPFPADLDGHLNLIHLDDGVNTILAAARADQPSNCYVVSDGHPVVRRQYYEEMCRLLGIDGPEFVLPTPGTPAAARSAGSKKIRSDRFRAELDLRLCFPNYRLGLADILHSSGESQE